MAQATFSDGSTEHLNGSEGGSGEVSVLPQKSGHVAAREEEWMLRRRLARSRIAEAKRLTEEAQNLLDRAARNLCPVVGAVAKHRKAGALSVKCRQFWDELDSYERTGRYALDGASEGLQGRGEVER